MSVCARTLAAAALILCLSASSALSSSSRVSTRVLTARSPEALRSQIRFAIRREAGASTPSASLRAPGWLAYAASILLAVAVGSGGTFVLVGERQTGTMETEIIDSHLRSLLGNHLTDVASSDQHTDQRRLSGRLAGGNNSTGDDHDGNGDGVPRG